MIIYTYICNLNQRYGTDIWFAVEQNEKNKQIPTFYYFTERRNRHYVPRRGIEREIWSYRNKNVNLQWQYGHLFVWTTLSTRSECVLRLCTSSSAPIILYVHVYLRSARLIVILRLLAERTVRTRSRWTSGFWDFAPLRYPYRIDWENCARLSVHRYILSIHSGRLLQSVRFTCTRF